jgi:hypothetical protein
MVFLSVETLPCGRTCAVLLATISNPFAALHYSYQPFADAVKIRREDLLGESNEPGPLRTLGV